MPFRLSLSFSDVCAHKDSFGCYTVELRGSFLACSHVSIEEPEPWCVDYDSLVNFEEFADDSVYVVGAFEYFGLDDV